MVRIRLMALIWDLYQSLLSFLLIRNSIHVEHRTPEELQAAQQVRTDLGRAQGQSLAWLYPSLCDCHLCVTVITIARLRPYCDPHPSSPACHTSYTYSCQNPKPECACHTVCFIPKGLPKPLPECHEMYCCGWHSVKSFSTASYLIRRPEGNILVDSPRC